MKPLQSLATLLASLALSLAASHAQTPATSATNQDKPQQPVAPVQTTIEVHADTKDAYHPDVVSIGTLNGAPLSETPISATVVTRQLLLDQGARTLADVIKNDASIGEDYAPVGYYGDYEIRGFPIDLATGLQLNGLTIAGEQDVPLENKERVEFLKGIAGVESGVASAGGLINYVTKRPTFGESPIQAMDLATDHRGSAYGATDLGRLFGSAKQIGARVNLVGERIASYVNGANGWRAMGAGAADWHLSPEAILKTDFEYQHKVERSVCGYQLLGGTTVPDIDKLSPSTMLGYQPWAKPNTFDTYNTGARFDYDLPRNWHVFAAASLSHSLIDDNVIYAYGNSENDPYYFFAPDGTYDVYDYRNPGELRINSQIEALLLGHLRTGSITHEVAIGGSLFTRSVRMPGYYTVDTPSSPDGIIQDGSVYAYLGPENIYQPNVPYSIEDPVQQAGPRRLYENNHQPSLILQDRIHLPAHIDLLAGGRFVSLRDHNYSANATNPAAAVFLTDKNIWLPTFAASIAPIKPLLLYTNYNVMLSLGPQAPWWATNANQFLSPYFTRQAEIGAKYEPAQRILLTGALFHLRAPFFYPMGNNDDELTFTSEGHETHDGIELNAQGRASRWLQLTASAAAIRANSQDTGTPSFDNKQVINVPHVRTAVFADVLIPHARGLHLMPGWSYTDRNEATRDDTVSVPGYNLFNLGARWTPGGGQNGEEGHVTLRLYADNITDKRYWKDTGASLGDTFIHLGAPTTVRLSAHYTF